MGDVQGPACTREGRVYSIGGVRVPSVTDVIRHAGLDADLASIPAEVLQMAAQRGGRVHELTALYDTDEELIDWVNLTPKEMGYLDAYMHFRACRPTWRPVLIEQPVFSAMYGFAGTLDRVYRDDGDATWDILVDIKTGMERAVHGLQLAGYKLALPAERAYRRYGLHLKPTGDWKLVAYEDNFDVHAFTAALTLVKWKMGKGMVRL